MQMEKYEQPDWLEALKDTGREIFETAGLPTPANEDWKYTSLRPYEREGFTPATAIVEVEFDALPQKLCDRRLVFINGRFVKKFSDAVEGIEIVNLGEMLDSDPDRLQDYIVDLGQLADMPLKADNTAHITDGAVLMLGAGQKIAQPVEILYFSTDLDAEKPQFYTRNLFMLGAGAECALIEHHTGTGRYAVNHVTDILLGAGAGLRHYRLQKDSDTAFHFAHARLMQHDNSSYRAVTMTAGARLSRHDIQSLLIGRDVSCNINGLYMLAGVQHYDAKILIDHMEPDGISNQLYKGILDDKTRAVFQGKVHVRRAAQGTDGRQLNHALLLSDQAEVDAKPELEIYADDVQCAHGATSGALDEEPLFYMRSRGIPIEDARRLLIGSFLSEVIADIPDSDIQDIYQKEIDHRLASMQEVK